MLAYMYSSQGQTKVKRAGQCCEDCVTSKGSCLYEGILRYHGDMWNGTGCEFCMCERGQVLCQRVECARAECPRVCVQISMQSLQQSRMPTLFIKRYN